MRTILIFRFPLIVFPILLSIPGCVLNGTPERTDAIGFIAAAYTSSVECYGGWNDTDGDGLCGIADLSFTWSYEGLSTEEQHDKYLHPDISEGDLVARNVSEIYSYAIDCYGNETTNFVDDYPETTHFWLNLVQANQKPLPDDVHPPIDWTVEIVTFEANGYKVVDWYTPTLISEELPDLCVNLHFNADAYEDHNPWLY